jgi:hypothetical protein
VVKQTCDPSTREEGAGRSINQEFKVRLGCKIILYLKNNKMKLRDWEYSSE